MEQMWETMMAQRRTGLRIGSVVRHMVIVSSILLFFWSLKVMDTFCAEARLWFEGDISRWPVQKRMSPM
eukprot:3743180-Ditylum_brightwellii.AAC.1